MPKGIPLPNYSNGNALPSFFVDLNGCWIWTRSTNKAGYAMVRLKGSKDRNIHKVHWEAFNGPMPDGLEPDHLCRVRCCVNPAHIEAVTHRVNVLRGVGKAAIHAKKTMCIRGHEFNESNTYTIKRPNGLTNRNCKACRRLSDKRRGPRTRTSSRTKVVPL